MCGKFDFEFSCSANVFKTKAPHNGFLPKMKKLTLYLMPLLTLLLVSSCSNFRAEKEIVTVEKIIKPTIALATKPNPVIMKNSDVILITEENLDEVIQKVKALQG